MNEEELERRLRRFRVAGPLPGLRDRVFAAVEHQTPPAPVARWVAAAAALLLLTLAAGWSTDRLIARAGVEVDNESVRFAETIAREMGSTEEARLAVSRIVAETLTRQLDRPNSVSRQEPQAP